MADRKKLGIPARGSTRHLTTTEARLLGCSDRWRVRHGSDGVLSLLRPFKRHLFVVEMTPRKLQSLCDLLRGYWGRDQYAKGLYVPEEHLQRIGAACAAALARAEMPVAVRAELQWVVDALK